MMNRDEAFVEYTATLAEIMRVSAEAMRRAKATLHKQLAGLRATHHKELKAIRALTQKTRIR